MDVHFHTEVLDVTAHASHLVRRALSGAIGLTVVGAPALLKRLSHELWSGTPQSFFPHLLLEEGAMPSDHAKASLVWLMPTWLPGAPTQRVLNLGPALLPEGLPHERAFEIIGLSPEARHLGRQHWQAYQQRGDKLHHHKIPS